MPSLVRVQDEAVEEGIPDEGLATISHLEQGVNQNITLNNFISLLRVIGMEQRLFDLLPELPMPPVMLKQINKLMPKRVRRNSDDTAS